jgi:hypothetical protein
MWQGTGEAMGRVEGKSPKGSEDEVSAIAEMRPEDRLHADLPGNGRLKTTK